MKVRVVGYQSIEEVELEFAGFSVITGASNRGKSALLRALRAALLGQRGEHFVRNGAPHCGVVVEGQGYSVRWRKVRKPTPDRPSALQVNGVTHTKVGFDHGKLTKPLGFWEVEAGGQYYSPQIAKQHDLPFLIGETPSVAAELLRELGRTDVVARALELAKADNRSTGAQLKVRTADRDRAQRALTELDYLPKLLEELDQCRNTLDANEVALKGLLGLLTKLQRYRELEPQALPRPPVLQEGTAAEKLRLILRYQGLAPTTLPVPPKLQPPSNLLQDLEKLRLLDRQQVELKAGLSSAKERQDITRSALLDLQQVMKLCPTCERPFEDAHRHE